MAIALGSGYAHPILFVAVLIMAVSMTAALMIAGGHATSGGHGAAVSFERKGA